MEVNCTYIPYADTGYFSTLVQDYLSNAEGLRPFYRFRPDDAGIRASIAQRNQFSTNRALLVEALQAQYAGKTMSAKQAAHLDALLKDYTYTVTTAHQPNIFTGPLYFIYKIIHAIKLADELSTEMPDQHFVPVYYMGSEDADLDELGYIKLQGHTHRWETKQTGAVGRMLVDNAFLQLIEAVYGQIGVLSNGPALAELFRNCYTKGRSIQEATFDLVHQLFAEFGLLVVIPDSRVLKAAFIPVIEKELTTRFSHAAVEKTAAALAKQYKVQASGREINLFYLIDNHRERIEADGDDFVVQALNLRFTKAAMLEEVRTYPERFSPNVILRGVFQETILPNIAFIGGGGELAYWLELEQVFAKAEVPYPVLILRNSFLLMEKAQHEKLQLLDLSIKDIFQHTDAIMQQMVRKQSANQLSLDREKQSLEAFYAQLAEISGKIDATLVPHTAALKEKAMHKLEGLEKKLFRAEKRKYADQQRQIAQLRAHVFPGDSLQERAENFSIYYSTFGVEFLQKLYHASRGTEQQFCIVQL